MRETIESIAIAFALAFLFKAFEAEAFVIPTGSMAPTLMGRHKDVVCAECGYRYSASASEEANRDGTERNDPNWDVTGCTCPICRFPLSVDARLAAREGRKVDPSYSGDRIWVSKVPYHLMEPRRWDVIVFRFPEEAETYYIKRLIGLPHETVKIRHGDVYTKGPDDADFVLARKPPDKVQAMAQVVHDNDYVSPALLEHGWPSRWQLWTSQDAPGAWQVSEDTRNYSTDGKSAEDTWIRYQHIVPQEADWGQNRWSSTKPRPQLITDFYAFNTRVVRSRPFPLASTQGLHWVGDLVLDCQLDVEGEQGAILLDLVKGGRHFRCTIDVATGKADLSIDGLPDWKRTGATSLRPGGTFHVMFSNVDRQLTLWINEQVVSFDQPATYDAIDDERPRADGDGGDLAPIGIGSRGVAMKASHLRVLRDIYYIAEDHGSDPLTDFRGGSGFLLRKTGDELAEFFASPEQWNFPGGGSVFDTRQEVVFPLEKDQFFVLGDNSPASSDARLWGQHFVERDLLIGKALFVYWPHALELPIPFTNKSIGIIPNFGDMGLIR